MNVRRCGTARGQRRRGISVGEEERKRKGKGTNVESVHSRNVGDEADERPLASGDGDGVSPAHARRRQ
jgi:hypothetical protein